MLIRELKRVDELGMGDVVIGTQAGDTYPDPKFLASLRHAPEHSVTGPAYWLNWMDGTKRVYYGKTKVWVKA